MPTLISSKSETTLARHPGLARNPVIWLPGSADTRRVFAMSASRAALTTVVIAFTHENPVSDAWGVTCGSPPSGWPSSRRPDRL